jgi:hypothetical protein
MKLSKLEDTQRVSPTSWSEHQTVPTPASRSHPCLRPSDAAGTEVLDVLEVREQRLGEAKEKR